MKLHQKYAALAAIATVVSIGWATSAAAAVTQIESSAQGLYVNLTVLSGISATVGPVATAAGTAPAAYSASNTVLSVTESLFLSGGLLGTLAQGVSTGVITASAQSGFNGFTGATGSATANIDELGLGLTLAPLLPILPTLTLLGLGAEAVTSTTWFDGASLQGTTTLAGLTIGGTLITLPINGAAYVNPAANTVLLDLLGLRIVLNEQVSTSSVVGDDSFYGLTTNAIRITLTDFLSAGSVLNGDIIVGQSYAGYTDSVIAAVPEPATWAMLIAGFGMVGVAARRNRRAQVSVQA